jgi:hypothetical protein
LTIDEREVCFFVGLFRKKRICIARSALEATEVGEESFYGERQAVLRFRFSIGALDEFRRFLFTPYLTVRAENVLIWRSHVSGDLEAMLAACRRSFSGDE